MRQRIPGLDCAQVPDILLDRWLPALTGDEFKIVLYVYLCTPLDPNEENLPAILHAHSLAVATGLSEAEVLHSLGSLTRADALSCQPFTENRWALRLNPDWQPKSEKGGVK